MSSSLIRSGLPMADEVRVGLASCDHSLAEIWRDVLLFAS